MHNAIVIFFCVFALLSHSAAAQAPLAREVSILQAEDERRYDSLIEGQMNKDDPEIRKRAMLAAGRIGNEKAIPMLTAWLKAKGGPDGQEVAAFAIGEIESIKGADAILEVLADPETQGRVLARVVEAAGKIAAANAKDEKERDKEDPRVKRLREGILSAFEADDPEKLKEQDRDVVLAGLTAILRARPEGGDLIAGRFLTHPDARVRADAGNTLSRLRGKKSNETLRTMLRSETDAVARANAARALGSAEDKEAFDLLIAAAAEDGDSRVRISAIRSLGALREAKAAGRLLDRGEKLLGVYGSSKTANLQEKNELLELAVVLGRLMQKTRDERTVKFLDALRVADKYSSAETEVALARVDPAVYFASIEGSPENFFGDNWMASSAAFQAMAEIAGLEKSDATDGVKLKVRLLLVKAIGSWVTAPPSEKAAGKASLAVPELLRAFAAFKSDNTSGILRPLLEIETDLFIRAAVAEILADQPSSKENTAALKTAFTRALLSDKLHNDAQLAILDALYKVDKKEAVGTLLIALTAQDHLVRKKAMGMLDDKDLQKDFPGISTSLENARKKGKDRPLPYTPVFGTKLGQVLNTTADYRRALSRKNGQVRAVFTTDKGAFTINLSPADAPLTVDNFIKLARSGYFNGVMVHRVVPNFVMQDGDPRGDGNGGPGWSIRCEVNMLPYDRGAVGMALSGKDTGGSQWFVTHSPQPHLDGGYTVFGHVDEAGMKVVDNIARGDRIVSVKIIEGTGAVRKPARK